MVPGRDETGDRGWTRLIFHNRYEGVLREGRDLLAVVVLVQEVLLHFKRIHNSNLGVSSAGLILRVSGSFFNLNNKDVSLEYSKEYNVTF